MRKNTLITRFFKLFGSWLLPAGQEYRNFTRLCCSVFFGLLAISSANAQFMHASGTQILDKDDQPIILRGMGLGGWMIQEGYMLETSGFANPQYQIKAKIQDLIGESNTEAFYDAWLANHCTRRDIDSLASWGFNSVRLPMHYNLYTKPIEDEPVAGENTWLDKGFAMTDSLLKWCAANHIYLILDLHGAPGGQGHDAAISDYNPANPSLWESDLNKSKTVALWKKLAERYKDEEWIGGYDLINEPNWNFTGSNQNGCSESTNTPLKELYQDIIAAIREVDQNHMVIIEGNCWGNNHNGLHSPKLDNNMVISFHKYWNYNDQGSVQGMISLRNSVNAPLWLGESGENSNNWFTDAIKLVESNNIGWSWWPLKKVNSIVNPLTVVKNDGYADLLKYWGGTGTKPSVEVATDALMQLTENLKIENCIYRKDVIDAMFRQVNDDTTIPFGDNVVPGVIHASDFDLGRYNSAYVDSDTATYHVSTGGAYTAWNSGWSYRNDGVDIQTNTDSDPNSNQLNVGWTINGEWLLYTLNVDSTAAYDVTIHYSTSNNNTVVRFNINGIDQTGSLTLPATSGWGNTTIHDIVLYKGAQKFKFYFEKGGANFSYLNFELSKKLSETAFKASAASTATDGSAIYVSVNKETDDASVSATDFSVTINGTAATVTDVHLDANNPNQLVLTIEEQLYDTDVIKISYSGTTVMATDATALEAFTDLDATNNLPYHTPIPGKIEAEAFIENHGMQLEACSDTGAGQDVGYTDAGDYLLYRIVVAETNEYTVSGRIAANSQTGKIEFQQLSEDSEILNSVVLDVPVTGGWQNWKTATTKMTFNEGRGFLKVKINQAGLNMNWFDFSVVSGLKDERQGSLRIYPNPTESHLTIEVPGQTYRRDNALSIRSTTGQLVKHNEQLSSQALNKYYVGDLPAGLYIMEFSIGNKIYKNKFVVR